MHRQVLTSIDKSPGDGEDGVDPLSLNQQPVGDEGGSTGSMSSSWGRGTTPAGADRRNIEQRMGLIDPPAHLPELDVGKAGQAKLLHRAAGSAL